MSELKVARRCGFEIDEYSQFEKDPGKVPGMNLRKIFDAIGLTPNEHADFSIVAYRMYSRRAAESCEKGTSENKYSSVDSDKVHLEKRGERSRGVLDFVSTVGIKKQNTNSEEGEGI